MFNLFITVYIHNYMFCFQIWPPTQIAIPLQPKKLPHHQPQLQNPLLQQLQQPQPHLHHQPLPQPHNPLYQVETTHLTVPSKEPGVELTRIPQIILTGPSLGKPHRLEKLVLTKLPMEAFIYLSKQVIRNGPTIVPCKNRYCSFNIYVK